MQYRIKCSRPDFVAVVPQFLHDLHAADRFLVSMVENVKADKSGQQMTKYVVTHIIDFRY